MRIKNWAKIIKDEEHEEVRQFIKDTKKNFLLDVNPNIMQYYKKYYPVKYKHKIQLHMKANRKFLSKTK